MKTILGIVVKVAIAVAIMLKAAGGSGGSFNPLEAIVIFSIFYGLATLYVWHFTHNDIFVGGASLMSHAIALIINLCVPALIVVVPYMILATVLPGMVGEYIGGGILLILCLGCVLLDALQVIRMFKPDFLAGFME